ncbi:MAG TPA: hypothetical protein VKW04_08020, partial [Planctomycetota bacterium]|nr:hypothetical protein [Planctomycetota bacterium]
MGHEISYCGRCAVRIGGADFDKGKAFRVDGKGICANCLTSDDQNAIAPASPVRGKTSTRIKSQKAGHGTSSKLPPVRPEVRVEPSKAPLILGISAGVLVLLGGAYALLSGSPARPGPEVSARPPAPKLPAAVEEPPREKPEDPQLRVAREAVEAARSRAKSSPNDLEAQRAAWEEAARTSALTPYFKEASAGLQAVKELLAAAKAPDPVKPEAKPPAPPPAEAAPKPPEAGVSAAVWTAAMTKASAGDFDAAISELRKDPAGNPEADDLVQARAALNDSRGELSKLPSGQPIALSYRSDLG